MLDKKTTSILSNFLSEDIICAEALSGGSISRVYAISTTSNEFVVKLNSSDRADKMFNVEIEGLELIRKTKTIAVPEVICNGKIKAASFIILEKVQEGNDFQQGQNLLGERLADLHLETNHCFGLPYDNFIAELPQLNSENSSWVSFFITQRLMPQLVIAIKSGWLNQSSIPQESAMISRLDGLCPEVKPSLLHGDLWSGNYMISKNGVPYLIDPAVYYGHWEVDIAMSLLFGGFENEFYNSYFDVFPKSPGFDERVDIYQLYYLLVHLNLFGLSYKSSVVNIMNRYFRD